MYLNNKSAAETKISNQNTYRMRERWVATKRQLNEPAIKAIRPLAPLALASTF